MRVLDAHNAHRDSYAPSKESENNEPVHGVAAVDKPRDSPCSITAIKKKKDISTLKNIDSNESLNSFQKLSLYFYFSMCAFRIHSNRSNIRFTSPVCSRVRKKESS